MPFFLEYDTGTERPVDRLLDKLDGYADLAETTGRVWPVLFWLHSTRRERHLHQHLVADGASYPLVATAARDNTATNGRSPAEAVWSLHHHDRALMRLADLAGYLADTARTPT